MITITRRQARRLRAVFRRSALGIGQRGSIPPLVLRSDGSQLWAQHRYAALAVEHALDVEPGGTGAVALPLDALADFEGKDDAPVAIEATAPNRTVARWADRGIPQSREYAVPTLDALAVFPETPKSWAEAPAGLLDDLAEATLTACEGSTRYALSCILLRSDTGQVITTDGHQILLQGGYHFPFGGDVLIRRSPLFGNKALPRDRPISIARTETHVVLRAGPWTIFPEIQTEARFPRVDHVIPDPQAAATRLHLDQGDAAFLGEALERLPGADMLHSPATVDLNGRIAVRAKGADQETPTELVLARSRYTGAPARLCANRAFLSRALRLGFDTLEVVDPDSPITLRDDRRVYCFQPLSKDSAIAPADDAVRIEAPPAGARPVPQPSTPTRGGPVVSEKTNPSRTPTRRPPTSDEAAVGGSLAALIKEAEGLHRALGEAKARAGRLVVALRRQRRRERLLNSTLASLRALKLQGVAG